MKTAKSKTFDQIIDVLKELYLQHPDQDLMKHIMDATSDFKGRQWFVTNEELLNCLNVYKSNAEITIATDSEVDKIIEDANNLDKEDDELFNVNEQECWIC